MIVIEIIITRLDIIPQPGQVITALERRGAHEINNILLLESEKDIKEREKALLFFLQFLLVTGVKVISLASSILIAISILEKYIRTELTRLEL